MSQTTKDKKIMKKKLIKKIELNKLDRNIEYYCCNLG